MAAEKAATSVARVDDEVDWFGHGDETPPPSRGKRSQRRSTRYELRDAAGELRAIHERVDGSDGKQMRWFRPDGSAGLNGTPVAQLPLYGSERLGDWGGRPIMLTEGEKDAAALIAAGVPALGTVTGAAGTPEPPVFEVLRGRDVVVWPDNDDAGRQHMERVTEQLLYVAASVRILAWPGAPPGGGAADLLTSGTAGDVAGLATAATPARTPEAELRQAIEKQDPAFRERLERAYAQVVATDEPPVVAPDLGADQDALPEPVRQDLAAAPADVDAWEIEGLLRPNRMVVVGGPAGLGKSRLRNEVEMRAASGVGEILGRFAVRRPMRVLTIEEDNGEAEEWRRTEAVRLALGIERTDLNSLWRLSLAGFRLDDPRHQRYLQEQVERLAIELLLLDPVSEMYLAKEVREELLPVRNFLKRLLREQPGLALILFHHTRKMPPGQGSVRRSLEDLRGAIWSQIADAVAILSPTGDDDRLYFDLSKRVPRVSLVLEVPAAGALHCVAEPGPRPMSTDNRVLSAIEAGAETADEIATATGISRSTVYATVKRLRTAKILAPGTPLRGTSE